MSVKKRFSQRVVMGEVLVIDKKVIAPENVGPNDIYVGLEDVEKNDGYINIKNVGKSEIKSNKYKFTSDHILYGKLRPVLNKVALPNFSGVCSTDIYPILVDNNKVDKKYIYFLLRGSKFVKYASNRTSGANLPRVNEKIIYNYQIPFPPLEVQQQIASTLDAASELLTMRKQQLAELDELIKSIFHEMFGDTVTKEKGWDEYELKSIILDVKNGITRRGKESSQGSIVLRLKDIRENYINYDDPQRFEVNQKELNLYNLSSGQLLFIRVNGNPDNVGRCAVFTDIGQPVYYNDHIMRVTVNNDKINSIYLSRLLNFPYGKLQIKNHLKTSAGQYTINQEGLSRIVIPLPPLDLQNQFADIVTKIEEQKSLVKQAIDETQQLFDSLMSQYFDD